MTCGGGIQTRRRQCENKQCQGQTSEQRKCNTYLCKGKHPSFLPIPFPPLLFLPFSSSPPLPPLPLPLLFLPFPSSPSLPPLPFLPFPSSQLSTQLQFIYMLLTMPCKYILICDYLYVHYYHIL